MPGIDYLLPATEVSIPSPVAGNGPRLPVSETSMGTQIVHGKKIFRAGTFRDSIGIERTWEIEDLDGIVANFHTLRANQQLQGVPVRIDHTFLARDVVGWISDVRREGLYLHADFHFTEFEAYRKWETGTYEPVSAEMADYMTNSGDVYKNTLIGVAFVDIPAVEGLFRAPGPENTRVFAMPVGQEMLDSATRTVYESAQEDNMTTTATSQTNTTTNATGSAAPAAGAPVSSLGTEDLLAHQNGATGAEGGGEATPNEGEQTGGEGGENTGAGEGEQTGGEGDEGTGAGTEGEQAPAEGAQAQPTVATHGSAVSGTVNAFRVNGVQVTDFGIVQAHIDSLEQFRSAKTEEERTGFVDALVRDNKIVANQRDSMIDLARSMDGSQFSKFKESFEGATANPLLATYGNHNGPQSDPNGSTPVNGVSAVQDEIQVLTEIVARHEMAGKSKEWIEATESFQKLQALKTTTQPSG